MSAQNSLGSDSSPESLFAGWLARRETGEEADLEEICWSNPEAAERLRSLARQHDELEELKRRFGLAGSIAERLSTSFGSEVDPKVELEGEDASDFTSKLLGRLSGRASASSRYRLKGEVASGGMGAILRVWDEDLRRHLAMKVVLGRGEAPSPGKTPPVDRRLLARFLEEAQVTGQLDHPGIVPVHELGLDAEGHVYFTMKLVEGRHFGEVLELVREDREGWTQTRALGVIQKVCDAMAYAHSRGVVHRDLKPANVMVGKFGEAYVMDWGLARILAQDQGAPARVESEREAARELDPTSSLHTLQGAVMGTPAYMPPEQALGRIDEIGPPSDVYAVGAMLYHLLAGHPPYVEPGSRPSHVEVWQRVKAGPPAELTTEARTASVELVAICERAMSRDAKLRYPDMAALAADLSAYVEGRVVSAYEAGAWAEARKWVQRNRPLAAALAAVVVLLMVGLVSSLLLKAQSDANAEDARLNAGRADAKAQEAQTNLTLAQKNEQEAKDNLTLAQRNEAEAKAQRAAAERNATLAQEQQRRAEAETAKVLRLSDVKVLQELEAEADKLWPAHSEKIPALQSWLDQARALASNLPGHRATLAEMRARAHPWSDEERARDRETHPRAGELGEKQVELTGLIAQLDQGLDGETEAKADQRVTELEREVAALTSEVESRRTWTFGSPEEQWQHDVLAELIGHLQEFEGGLLADDVITADHGWSVPKRLAFARGLAAGFGAGGEYATAWAGALPAILEAYPGLELKPQMGLLPIGPDPASGLWEFAHLMTGVPAERGADGKLVPIEATGVVLVLLRGESFWMGAQSDNQAGRNYDPQATGDEGPVHEVELSAFFLSKYEMTQGQWNRVSGQNPSIYQLNTLSPTLMHPVEQVNWWDCMICLPRAGLALPSEAQWEYGARSGSETPWWTGTERESLRERRAANLADQAAARAGAPWNATKDWPELDDGYVAHAPVGSYAANGFGIHDVTGNVWEWCIDGYDADFYLRSPKKDPVCPPSTSDGRVSRGGSFSDSATFARSTVRFIASPSSAAHGRGVRPARAITP